MSGNNPVRNSVNSTGGSLYDKLNELTEELREGILSLSGTDTNRNDLQAELDQIKSTASQEKSPETAASILLFRKYAEIANHLKESHTDQSQNSWDLSSFVQDGSIVETAGKSSMGWKVFWLRISVVILTLISFVIMSNVNHIGFQHFRPWKEFHNSCGQYYFQGGGYFNYIPYKAVIAAGVTAFLCNFVMVVYFSLPLDENQNHHVPGLANVMEHIFSQKLVHCTFCGSSTSEYTKTLGVMLLDGALLCIALVTLIVASIEIEKPVEFQYGTYVYLPPNYWSTWTYHKMWYTIGSFYATFSQSTPVCLDLYNDPGPKIRASMAMMYLASFFMALCFVNSALKYRKETRKQARTLQLSSLSTTRSSVEQRGADEVAFQSLSSTAEEEEV